MSEHNPKTCVYCLARPTGDQRRRQATADAENAAPACVTPIAVGRSGLDADLTPKDAA